MEAIDASTGDELAACRRELELLQARIEQEREQAALDRAGLQLLLDNLPTGVVEYRDDRNLVWANRTFCRMVGLELEDLLGEGWVRTLHPDDAHIPRDAVGDESGARIAIRHVDVHGGVHHCDSSIVHLRYLDEHGVERTRPLVNVHEVTPLHLAQQARLAEERRFRTLFDTSPIGIVISDLDNVIQDMNPA